MSEKKDDHHEDRTKKINFTIDGARFTTRDDDQEAAALLRLIQKDPADFDLVLVKKNGEHKTFKDAQLVQIDEGDEFVTVATAYSVIINGQQKAVDGSIVDYATITALAFPDKVANPDITFVVLFRKAKEPKEGSLVEGGSVQIKPEGTIFNVTFTNRS